MTVTLESLVTLGAYINAGHLDIYDRGRHVRIGDVDASGNLKMEPAGAEFANRIVMRDVAAAFADVGAPIEATDPNAGTGLLVNERTLMPVDPTAPAEVVPGAHAAFDELSHLLAS
jgi:hypothetical protein